MDWRSQLSDKLMSPEEAVEVVKSGDIVGVGGYTCTPFKLCDALYARRGELENVRIDHPLDVYAWIRPGEENGFRVREVYATPLSRPAVNAGKMDYVPTARWRSDEIPPGLSAQPDVFLLSVSPPDSHGYCGFGQMIFFSRRLAQAAKTVVAEVHEDFIRTAGDNFIHVSEIDRFCEAVGPSVRLAFPPLSEEETYVTEVICTLVASELVHDRDTVQTGAGTVSSVLGHYLSGKHDLGMQTEVMFGGIPQLVRDGVLTGKYKTLHREKVVASGIGPLSDEEKQIVDGNPVFELYDFGYTDDVRMLMQHDNLVAVNNALLVDLTGQVASESIGTEIFTGAGGQTAFMIAAQYSRGGRSVCVLPSSHVIDGKRVTRIVPVLPAGTVVTVPRTLVDYVVTEHGIATLRGKTVRERIEELVAVAHPDFRGELKAEARRLYGVTV